MSDTAVLSLLVEQHEQLLAEIAALLTDIATVMGIVSRMDPKLAAMLTEIRAKTPQSLAGKVLPRLRVGQD
jgi:hypothetical protein